MKKYWGKGIQEGIAFGKTFYYERGYAQIIRKHVAYPTEEVDRFMKAVQETVIELQILCRKARHLVGEENAAIFEMQKLIASDDLLIDEVKRYILKHSCNAEYALSRVANDYAGRLALLEDEVMRAKSADCLDVSRRMLKQFSGTEMEEPVITEPVILLAGDLSPSETLNLDKEKILAIVLKDGSAYSHMAILAKSLGIPCLVQTEVLSFSEIQGKKAAVDGKEGCLYIEPSEEIIKTLEEKQKQIQMQRKDLHNLIGLENKTKDGKSVQVFANIETPKDMQNALEADAGGIGLFRTEFLFLSRNIYPEEEEQYLTYKEVVEGMQGKKVIIRTLDIGADKNVPYLLLPKEENPAMGIRGLRLCLQQKQIFLTQLKALLRASVHGNLDIMVPMVASAWEIDEVKKLLEEAKQMLEDENKSFGSPGLGIMIETPAAAVISEELAKKVDFFSIGTNDLMQYALAADRMNPAMGAYVDAHHPALYKLIEMTVVNGHRAGIPVGICGELAADESMTEFFIRIGVDELSMSAGDILSIRKKIRSLDFSVMEGNGE